LIRRSLKALCRGRVLLGREEKIEGRTGRVKSPIKVTLLAFRPDISLVHTPAVIGRLQVMA